MSKSNFRLISQARFGRPSNRGPGAGPRWGMKRAVAELDQEDVIGELALLDPSPRSASVTAVTDSRMFRLDQEPFYELLEDRSEVARKMLQVMARRLRRSSSGKRQERARDDLWGDLQEKLVRPA